ncbi:MAG: polyprenyl synthetase family protein [Ignavibacteria bacterium]|nr:polyprenyl synthetase family protein [Ignavibacteria bacterium]
MADKLTKISKPIENELKQFSLLFRETMKTKVALVNLITSYILKQKGKKIRPTLVLLSAKIAGKVNERSYRGAILVELLHTATLVHDDVVDSSEERRGFPSINAVWKNKVAVLIGDYLLSRGLLLSVDNNDTDFLQVMTRTVKRMSEGELLQISKTRKLNIDEETYFRIISDKTASLLSTCCEIGALSAGDDLKIRNSLKNYGENLGIAFQIKDDILDFNGKNGFLGKPLGGDVKEKKITLPLIYALNKSDKAERKKIIHLIKNGKKKENLKKVVDIVNFSGGIEYAEKVANDYINRAKNELAIFPDSEIKKSLNDLLDFVVNRTK